MFSAHARTQGFFKRKSANLPQRGFIALKYKRICVWQICCRLSKMWQIVADCGDSFWEKVHFPSSIIQLYTLSHPTLHIKTLHGVSAYTPRSIGLHSTEYRLTLHGALTYHLRPMGLMRPMGPIGPIRPIGLMRPMGPIGLYSLNSYFALVCLLKNLKLQVPFRELFCYMEKKPYLYPADCEYK